MLALAVFWFVVYLIVRDAVGATIVTAGLLLLANFAGWRERRKTK